MQFNKILLNTEKSSEPLVKAKAVLLSSNLKCLINSSENLVIASKKRLSPLPQQKFSRTNFVIKNTNRNLSTRVIMSNKTRLASTSPTVVMINPKSTTNNKSFEMLSQFRSNLDNSSHSTKEIASSFFVCE